MPIFSLPSDFGIGTLGRDACDFIDFLAAADVHVWEIMPICHTDSSFSPHNALCARAGNPLLIDLQPFVDQGVFSSRELSRMDWGRDRAKISYSKVAAAKYKALEMVFDALGSLPDSSFDRFREDNQEWLEDYALFAAIYEQFQYLPLPLWGDGVARRSHAVPVLWTVGTAPAVCCPEGCAAHGVDDLRAARNQCGAVDRSRCQ